MQNNISEFPLLLEDVALGFSHELQKLVQIEIMRLLSIKLSFLILYQFTLLIYFNIKFGNSDCL